jgi:hypothetical protein
MRYRSLNCDGCPLVALCLQKQKDGEPATGADGRVRNIRRDAYADVRERAAQRMATPESKAQYTRRSPIAETPFAWLKGVLGLRQFRHVGLEKVETEWRWACLTMNLIKILSVLSRLRRLITRTSAPPQSPVPESRRSKHSSHRRGDPRQSIILQRASCERVKVHSILIAIPSSRDQYLALAR